MSTTAPILRVGLAGLGTVGASVWKRLASQNDLIRQRIGTEIRVDQVADRRVDWLREIGGGGPGEMALAAADDGGTGVLREVPGEDESEVDPIWDGGGG